MTGQTNDGPDQPTMRLRDRRSDAGVLGDITNKKEDQGDLSLQVKPRSKVRKSSSTAADFEDRFSE